MQALLAEHGAPCSRVVPLWDEARSPRSRVILATRRPWQNLPRNNMDYFYIIKYLKIIILFNSLRLLIIYYLKYNSGNKINMFLCSWLFILPPPHKHRIAWNHFKLTAIHIACLQFKRGRERWCLFFFSHHFALYRDVQSIFLLLPSRRQVLFIFVRRVVMIPALLSQYVPCYPRTVVRLTHFCWSSQLVVCDKMNYYLSTPAGFAAFSSLAKHRESTSQKVNFSTTKVYEENLF